MPTTEVKSAAQRAIDDPDYAWEILQGSEYPEVRDALMQDIQDSDEVSGFLNPQPLPPKTIQYDIWRTAIMPRWSTINFTTTRGIIVVGG